MIVGQSVPQITVPQILLGYMKTRTRAPIDFGGRLDLNLALTTPLLPWGLVTLPQMQR